jgi:hypothetical protein
MKDKMIKSNNEFSLPAIFKEVKQTVLVYLNEEGINNLKHTPYLRGGSYLSCGRIIDTKGPHYLFAIVRYYKDDLNKPKHAYIAIPHSFIKFMISENPFFENNILQESGKTRKGNIAP